MPKLRVETGPTDRDRNGLPPTQLPFMKDRRNEIDEEIRHLKRLASAITDQKTLDGITSLIADLEAEKTELDSPRGSAPDWPVPH